MNIEMERMRITASLAILAALMIIAASTTAFAEDSGVNCDIFNTQEILDESTLDIKILKDWHWDAQQTIPNAKMVIIPDLEQHPGDFHLSTA